MDALIETFDESTLRIIAKDLAKPNILVNIFVEKGTKDDLTRITNGTEAKDRDLMILKKFTSEGNIPALTKIFLVLDIGQYSELINYAKTQETCDFLLMNGLDLDKVESLNTDVEEFVLTSITTKVLAKSFNPNRKLSVRNGLPLWRDCSTYNRMFSFLKYNGPNYSCASDINATNNDGNTLLYNISSEYLAKLLTYNPDQTIKNKEGKTPYERRKKMNMSVEGLIAPAPIVAPAPSVIDYQKRALAYEERNNELLKENKEAIVIINDANDRIKKLEEQLQEKTLELALFAEQRAKLQNILA